MKSAESITQYDCFKCYEIGEDMLVNIANKYEIELEDK